MVIKFEKFSKFCYNINNERRNPMKSIERVTEITEEIWHDMCGEGSSYEIEQKTVLHGSENLSDDAGGGDTASSGS